MTNQPINPTLLNNLYQSQTIPSLQLTQIDGFDPVPEFTDSNGTRWQLVKSANSGMSEIPDPQSVNITDYWNHEYPGSGGKVFIYVVEGVRVPKTNRETACNVLYSWFSTVDNKKFTPQMIKQSEWLMANVYASAITDSRVSKLKALCRVEEQQQVTPAQTTEPVQPAPLINMESLRNGNDGTNPQTRSVSADNQGKQHKSNR